MGYRIDYKSLTKVTQQDLDDGVWDAEHKGLYSKDGKRFLQYIRPKELEWGQLDSFTFKSGVEVICEKAFSMYHSPLESLAIPESVVAIGDEAFQQVRLPLHSCITIPKGLKYIGYKILGNFRGVIDLIIEEGITEIDLGHILDCAPAVTLYLPSTLESISENGFGECDGTEHINLAAGNKHFCVENGILYDYSKTTLLRCPITKRGELRIPEGVTTIGANALRLSGWPDPIDAEPEPKLSVILPQSLKKIEVGAFRHTWIDYLYIPANVSEIAEVAFENPNHLKVEVAPDNKYFEVRNNLLIDKRAKKVLFGMSNDIEIPDNIKEIGDYALTHLEAKSVVIPEGVTRIGHHNLDLYTMLQISLPSTLETISRDSFWGFIGVPHEIIVPSGMGEFFKEKIYDFNGDYDIRSYIKEIPENLKVSDDGKTLLGVYENSVTSIEIPFGIQIVGERAFEGCWLLREVVLPQTVKQIKSRAFKGCKYLRSINLPALLTEIEQASFEECEFLKTIDIPKNVKRIGDFAFAHCSSLKKVELPQHLQELGDRAFWGCNSLESITLPKSLKKKGKY